MVYATQEFKQYGRCLSLWIDGVPAGRRKEARMFFNKLRLCLKNVDGYIDRAHRIGKPYFGKKASKNVRALLLNLQYSGIAQ